VTPGPSFVPEPPVIAMPMSHALPVAEPVVVEPELLN